MTALQVVYFTTTASLRKYQLTSMSKEREKFQHDKTNISGGMNAKVELDNFK